jgi:hypothetical protein
MDDDRRRERSQQRVDWAFRELLSNLLRLARPGTGGKPYQIFNNLAEAIEAVVEYNELFEHGYSLSGDFASDVFCHSENEFREDSEIISGAAQIIASRIIGQKTQSAAGEHEMHQGFRNLREDRKRRHG